MAMAAMGTTTPMATLEGWLRPVAPSLEGSIGVGVEVEEDVDDDARPAGDRVVVDVTTSTLVEVSPGLTVTTEDRVAASDEVAAPGATAAGDVAAAADVASAVVAAF